MAYPKKESSVQHESPVGSGPSGTRRRPLLGRVLAVLPFSLGMLALTSAAVGAQVATAADCPNSAVRAEQRSTSLADCRAYELVSPADKVNGSVAFPTNFPGYSAGFDVLNAASVDGNTAAFSAYASFADPKSGGVTSYRSARSALGWQTRMWSPKTVLPHASLPDQWFVQDATADLKTGFMETGQPYNPLDDDFGPSDILVTRDVYTLSADGVADWQSRPNGEQVATERIPAYHAGHSEDGSATLFQTTEKLVPEANGQIDGAMLLYKRQSGATSLVGLDDDGAPVGTCGSVVATSSYESVSQDSTLAMEPVQGSVSRDGSRVYFSSPDPEGYRVSADPACYAPVQVYLRGGSRTIRVSASQRATPDTPADAIFQGASADGNRVFFLSSEALTDTATPGTAGRMLYEYDVASGHLVLLTPAGNVRGVSFVSDDGSHVYYLQDGVLKVAVDGSSRSIAPIGSGGGGGGLTGRNPHISATPDGQHLLYTDDADPTNVGATVVQAYLYSAEDDQLTCVSCTGDGGYASRDVILTHPGSTLNGISRLSPENLSADGHYAFFETPAALVPGDVNEASDVYQWHDGVVSLVSDGQDESGSYFMDSSSDGRDVFFGTGASLVAWDFDRGDQDIYDARIGGGFAEPVPAPVPCSGDQCQGAPTGSIAPAVLGTVTFHGSGNDTPSGRAPSSAMTIAKPKAVTGTTATLKIKVPSAGAITLSGSAVGKQTKKANKAATYSIKVSLTTKVRASLKKKKTLKVNVMVAFKPRTGALASKKVTVTFKQPRSKKGGR